ncbi:MAG: hypothetical protein WD512_20800 [Candidatus Paceibacterota bacterium]
MKKLLILGLLILITSSCSYRVYQSQEVQKTMEVTTGNEDLYIDVNTWMVETFNSAESVIQFSDKESGIVMGRYFFGTISTVCGKERKDKDGIYAITKKRVGAEDLYAIIKVQVRANKVKLTIQPEAFESPETSCDGALQKAIDTKVSLLGKSLEKYLRENKNRF